MNYLNGFYDNLDQEDFIPDESGSGLRGDDDQSDIRILDFGKNGQKCGRFLSEISRVRSRERVEVSVEWSVFIRFCVVFK